MKNLIGIIIFILALFLVFFLAFNMTEITVIDMSTGKPVSFARTGCFYADENGKSVFLGTILNNRLNISRIGYKDKIISLPVRLLKKTVETQIEENNYQGLVDQVTQWSGNLNKYKYTFSTNLIQNNATEVVEFDARKIGKDFYFVTKNSGDETKTITVISTGNDMYVSENGEPLKGPLSDQDRQKFANENIVFLPLNDIISGSFPADEPLEMKFDKNTIEILWSGTNTASIHIDKNGNVSEIDFSEVGPNKTFWATLKINTINVEEINANENGQ